MRALTQSTHASVTEGEHRDDDAGDERGEEARGVRLDGCRTLRGERHRPVGLGPALGRCVSHRPSSRSRRATVTSTPTQAATRSLTHARAGADPEQPREPQRRRAQVVPSTTATTRPAERDRQADRGDALEHAHDRQDGDRLACGRCRPEQPGVEGPHRGCRPVT